MVQNILIVDDDPEDRELLRLAIYQVDPNVVCEEVVDGEKALAFLANCQQFPDFIFLDLNMPRITGMKTLEIIKSNPSFKAIPVVIYSTSKLNIDRQKSRELGAIHFITKPDKLEDLENALKYVFTKSRESAIN